MSPPASIPESTRSPSPVCSRRLKRKRKRQDPADTVISKKAKRQNSVWVGNLSFKTTTDALRGFFDGVGEITRIHMPMRAGAKGENTGFAYVDFASPDHKVIAITLSERDFQGRKLLIKDGDDFTGRPTAPTEDKAAPKILRIQKQPPAPTLFLGNLGFETTEKSIRELFEAHRGLKKKTKEEQDDEEKTDEVKDVDKWIRKIRMGTFEDTGKCKGWAFVDFTSTEHATAALVNPRNHRLDGRELVVEYASAEAVRRGGGGPRPKADQGTGARKISFRGHNDRSGAGKRGGVSRGGHGDSEGRGRTDVGDEIGRGANALDHYDAAPDLVEEVHESRRTHSGTDKGGYKGVKGRSKPGAALALAKRESAAIVASQGQKITF